MKQIKITSAFVQGRGHLKGNIPCQDRTFSIITENFSTISLADGAGSCKLSHIGAEIVTKKISEIIQQDFDKLIKLDNEKLQKFLISNLLIELDKYAKEKNIKIKDLASTLLFVSIKNNQYLAGHLGDGVIGYKDTNNKIEVLSFPENGEYSNSTFFVPTNNSYQHLRIFRGNLNNIDAFILMSDGSEESLYDKQNKKLSPVNVQMINWLDKYSTKVVNEALYDNLEKVIKMKTYDDCSIGIIKIVDTSIQYILEADISLKKELLFSNNTKYINNNIKIIEAIFNHKLMSINEIVHFTKVTRKTVKRHLKRLKDNEILDFEIHD